MPHPPSGVGVRFYKLKQMDDGQQDYSLSKKMKEPWFVGVGWTLSNIAMLVFSIKHTTDPRNTDQVPRWHLFRPAPQLLWHGGYYRPPQLVLTTGILCCPVLPLNWPSDQHSFVQNRNPSCFGTSLFQLLDSSSGPVLYSFSPPNV